METRPPRTASAWFVFFNGDAQKATRYKEVALKFYAEAAKERWDGVSDVIYDDDLYAVGKTAKAIEVAAAYIGKSQKYKRLRDFLPDNSELLGEHVANWRGIIATYGDEKAAEFSVVARAALLVYDDIISKFDNDIPMPLVSGAVSALLAEKARFMDTEDGRHYLWGLLGFGTIAPIKAKKAEMRLRRIYRAIGAHYDASVKQFTFNAKQAWVAEELIDLLQMVAARLPSLFSEYAVPDPSAQAPRLSELERALQRLLQ